MQFFKYEGTARGDNISSENDDRHVLREEVHRLATLCGLKQSTIDNIIRGTSRNPKVKTLHRIANTLGMTLSEFLDFNELNGYSIDDEE